MRTPIALMVAAIALNGCAVKSATQATQEDMRKFFETHKIGSSPDYAVVKNGDDYLITVHGYVDDFSVCMNLIKPLNDNPALSTIPGNYTCVQLNH